MGAAASTGGPSGATPGRLLSPSTMADGKDKDKDKDHKQHSQGKEANDYMMGDGGMFSGLEESNASQPTRGLTGLSPGKLKKMALGIPSYKEVHRDYADTLGELEFNSSQQVEWVAPPQGFEKRPEKLVDGPLYGMSSSVTNNHPTQDLRAAIAGGRGGQSGRTPQVMPGNRPRPPAPRRPANGPVSVPVPTAALGPGPHPYRAQSPSTMHVEAPSVLARPRAPMEGAPVMLQTYSEANPYPGVSSSTTAPVTTPNSNPGGNQNSTPNSTLRQAAAPSSSSSRVPRPSSGTSPGGAGPAVLSGRSPANKADEEELSYNHNDYAATRTNNKPAPPSATKTPPRSAAGPPLNGRLPSPVTYPDAPKEPPPNLIVRPFPGTGGDKDFDDGEIGGMYATFGSPPSDSNAEESKRPSFVPALSISSPAVTSSSPAQPYPVFQPSVPQKPSQPLARPAGSPAPVRPSQAGPGLPTSSTTRDSGTASAPARNSEGGKATHNAPPKPNTKSPHEVKETKDVKRNRAQLPSQLTHAKPTTGDWLKKRYIVNNYILLDILGAGSYGEVRMCKDRTSDHLYAIKIISKDLLKKKKNGNTSETYFEDIKREIAIMKKLLHPNVLRLFEVLDDPNVNKMYLVLEYMKKGDLINILKGREIKPAEGAAGQDTRSSVIKSVFTPLSDTELWNIFRQVAAGIRYLHYQNIVHGDIKPQNLLVGEDGVVKIADFGIAKMLHASGQKLIDAAGTPAFMAPELFDSGKTFSGQLSDIWAMGATMFMLRFGHPPFVAKSIVKLSEKILNDPLVFPYEIDDLLRDLLENMLLKDPTRRLTLQQVIMHKWMRTPPAAIAASAASAGASATATTTNASARSNTASAQRPTTGASNTSGSSVGAGNSAGGSDSGLSGFGFKPPPSYDNEEAAAMAVPVTADNDEIFMSIGMRSPPMKRAVSTEEGDEEEEEDEKEVDDMEEGGDVMATAWGADVFEMVDDEVNSDSDDEEAGMNTTDGSGTASPPKEKIRGKPKDVSSSTLMQTDASGSSQQRAQMTAEEEERRAKRFTESKLTKKSLHDLHSDDANADYSTMGPGYATSSASRDAMDPPLFRTGPGGRDVAVAPSKESGRTDAVDAKSGQQAATVLRDAKNIPGPGPPPGGPGLGPGKGLRLQIPQAEDKASVATSMATPISTPKSFGMRMPRSPGPSGGAQTYTDDEETEQLTMEEFEGLMDTLALQPRRDDKEALGPIIANLKPATFSAQLRNYENFVGAAFHSEQGRRDSQEDRCVLLPDVAAMRALEGVTPPLTAEVLEQLRRFSIAGVFDGHSGWRCAQYLSQNLVPTLVLHDKFLDKQPDSAVLDVFKQMDDQVCRLLRKENDSSGSTGVVAIYDGRRHILTVANVGDSMCVLSRGGRAVKLHRMHRVGAEDKAERQRVENAGGAIINNRVAGVLAVGRAFGDTQFKEPGYSPVIAVPDLCSEVITPMTEFGVIATDGLWDVMAPQLVVNFVRKKLTRQPDLQECARELVEEAMARGSVDNCTALILSFHMQQQQLKKSP